jgi:hypothetical protein
MTVTIVDQARPVTGGVDTHADMHVAAALDGIGGLLGVREFPATPAGYGQLALVSLAGRPFRGENRGGCPLTPGVYGRWRPSVSWARGAARWDLHCRLEHAD